MDRIKRIEGSIRGLIFADALGVPYEFYRRDYFKENRVTGLVEGGAHGQPLGYWSDDSGLMLAGMKSLLDENGEYAETASKEMVYGWYKEGRYMNEEHIFDIGCTTDYAFRRIATGTPWQEAGMTEEQSNGNGALMRILPYSLALYNSTDLARKVTISDLVDVASITHNHRRSHVGCLLYSIMINLIVKNGYIDYDALYMMFKYMPQIDQYDFADSLPFYNKLKTIKDLTVDDISSSGYVVDTLIAAVWCFETTDSYMECVIKAVELGDDTDTVAAVAGSLAGAKYGFESFQKEYVEIPRIDYIEEMITEFLDKIEKTVDEIED